MFNFDTTPRGSKYPISEEEVSGSNYHTFDGFLEPETGPETSNSATWTLWDSLQVSIVSTPVGSLCTSMLGAQNCFEVIGAGHGLGAVHDCGGLNNYKYSAMYS